MALTDAEALLIRTAFYRGPLGLVEDGDLTNEELGEFFDRDDVRARADQLKREFDQSDLLRARAKFAARRGLHALLDPSLAVLGLAVAGPQYQRDKKTKTVIRDSRGHPMLINPEPTAIQMRAIEQVLGGASLTDFRVTTDPSADGAVERLYRDNAVEEPRLLDQGPLGDTKEEQTLSLERVRIAVTKLSAHLPGALAEFREEFQAELTRVHHPTKRTVKKKASKKKALSKKATKRSGRGKTAG